MRFDWVISPARAKACPATGCGNSDAAPIKPSRSGSLRASRVVTMLPQDSLKLSSSPTQSSVAPKVRPLSSA